MSHLLKQSHQLGLARAGFLLQCCSKGVFFLKSLRPLIHPLHQLLPLHPGPAQGAGHTGPSPCAPLQQCRNALPVCAEMYSQPSSDTVTIHHRLTVSSRLHPNTAVLPGRVQGASQ